MRFIINHLTLFIYALTGPIWIRQIAVLYAVVGIFFLAKGHWFMAAFLHTGTLINLICWRLLKIDEG